MASLPWKPWREVVQLRDDLTSGELSLSIFAADLYDVAMGKARPVYQDPSQFFALTYPTFNLRELARDVVARLAGKNEKAVRQLELTYGGGKTHALITLFHAAGPGPNGQRLLPKSWRLGSKPNLRQMHHDACARVSPDLVEAKLLDETTGPDRPRVFRNALVLVVPSRDGLEAASSAVRDYLGWEEVRDQLKGQDLDLIRTETLSVSLDGARKRVPDAIRQAYSIVVKDLVGAFAQFPHLPKMLNRKAILDTVVGGCLEGNLVLRLQRPDRSTRTFWREMPDEVALKDPGLEAILPEAAELEGLDSALLAPGKLPRLWERPEITQNDLLSYFAGGRVVKVQREGYEEPVAIPKARAEIVQAAVERAVREGKLWLTSGPVSILGENIPVGILSGDAVLQAPPAPISPTDLLPDHLPEAWSDERASALSLYTSLSKRAGKTLPWQTVRETLEGAYRVRLLERDDGSGRWPCEFAGAQNATFRVPKEVQPPIPPPPPAPKPGVLVAEAYVRPRQIQDLAERVSDLTKAAVGHDLKFRLRVELGGATSPPDEVVTKVNQTLHEVSDDLKLGG